MVGVSDERKIIFIHIPKTGGQTIKESFPFEKILKCKHKNFIIDPVKRCIINNEPSNILYHLTYDQLINLYPELSNDEYYKFTFVRNPYDRLYSTYLYSKKEIDKYSIIICMPFIIFILIYYYFKNQPNIIFITFIILSVTIFYYKDFYKLYTYRFKSFHDFVKNINFIKNIIDYGFQSQNYYVKNANLNFIGREEQFESDLKELSNRIKLDIEIKSKNIITNRSTNSPTLYKYIQYYDNFTLNYVNTIYKEDFDNFEYTMINEL